MLLDILIIVVVAGSVYRSHGSGFVRQFCGFAGFMLGLVVGRALEPYIIQIAHTTTSRAIVTIVTIMGVALIGLTIGEIVGLHLKRHLVKRRINRVDDAFGGVLTGVTILLSVWLLAAVATTLQSGSVESLVKNSHIVSGLNRVLPPAPSVIASLGELIDPNGFPDVFIGSEPIPRGDIDLPALGDLATAVNTDKDSVVRLQGQGCGGIVAGSGFVIAKDLIATNAHVVAGITKPVIQDVNGTHNGRVVWFDPQLDFALVRVPDLAGKPLSFDTSPAEPGTPAAALGYPGGGKFTAEPAAVLNQLRAGGRDIYGRGHTVRDIYEIKASIIPGNSGGPLITKDGRVIGVVFAESTSYERIGYALTATKVTAEIKLAGSAQQTVSTGHCTD